MRMIGPNCMGVISLASGFVASFTSAPEHNDGNGWPDVGSVSVASQSGAVGIQMFAQLRDRGLGTGQLDSRPENQADIDVADAVAFYAGDPATRSIAVYMEDASRGLKLLEALELARRARKPVVALKVGTTPQGGKTAAGHTAAMYVEDRLVDDLFTQYGVLRAHSVNELIDLVAACNAGVVPDSPNVAAVSVSGGGAVMISDAASKAGLNLVDYPADALAALNATNSFVNDRNPIDISAPSMSNMEITGGHLKWGLERGQPTMIGYISHVPLVPRTRSAIMPQLLSFRDAHPDQLIAIAANMHVEDRKAPRAHGRGGVRRSDGGDRGCGQARPGRSGLRPRTADASGLRRVRCVRDRDSRRAGRGRNRNGRGNRDHRTGSGPVPARATWRDRAENCERPVWCTRPKSAACAPDCLPPQASSRPLLNLRMSRQRGVRTSPGCTP